MKAINTFGVQFIIRRNKVRKGMVPIYARITLNGKRLEISLKQFIAENEWNQVKEIAKGSRPEIRQLNQYISDVRLKLIECYKRLQLQNKSITIEDVKSKFLGEDISGFTLAKLMEYHKGLQS